MPTKQSVVHRKATPTKCSEKINTEWVNAVTVVIQIMPLFKFALSTDTTAKISRELEAEKIKSKMSS